MENNNIKEFITINPTQLLFNYLYVSGGKTEYNRILRDLLEIAIALKNENIKSTAVFHGCRKDGNVRGKTVDDELWYWISNEFIQREYDNEKIILSCSSKINPDVYQCMNWNLSGKIISILRDLLFESEPPVYIFVKEVY